MLEIGDIPGPNYKLFRSRPEFECELSQNADCPTRSNRKTTQIITRDIFDDSSTCLEDSSLTVDCFHTNQVVPQCPVAKLSWAGKIGCNERANRHRRVCNINRLLLSMRLLSAESNEQSTLPT